jgi:hypothetical protein
MVTMGGRRRAPRACMVYLQTLPRLPVVCIAGLRLAYRPVPFAPSVALAVRCFLLRLRCLAARPAFCTV